ncbi:hypothetical protein [Butyrivibrio sp.]|uniref:hypothetical protein n=1 Tax=Butyrivibrio sp. TaxID=28121 RepID=UPI0025B9CC4C|nr:hypothetical protein [Butyrivibrio sp.]MBQ7431352.1 hypothetical protein [Butyrivibrio sp.]MBQ9302707.1 hypothetical protein [Butyrivibrio sp.]
MLSLLKKSISDDYVVYIADNILDDVVEDIKASADEDYSDEDVKFANGDIKIFSSQQSLYFHS